DLPFLPDPPERAVRRAAGGPLRSVMPTINRRFALKKVAACALSAGAAAVFLAACSPKAASFQGVDVTGADYARDLPLTDQHGQRRSLKDFAGKVVVVFFGYTQCPDVCPTSMSELA